MHLIEPDFRLIVDFKDFKPGIANLEDAKGENIPMSYDQKELMFIALLKRALAYYEKLERTKNA